MTAKDTSLSAISMERVGEQESHEGRETSLRGELGLGMVAHAFGLSMWEAGGSEGGQTGT